VRDEELLDDAGALAAYRRLLTLRPGDSVAEEAIERSAAKKAKWKDLAQKYFVESKSSGDAAFKSSLLVSAAETAYRYGRPELEAKARAAREESDPGPVSKRGAGKKKKKKGEGEPKKDDGGFEEKRQALITKILGLLNDALAADPKNRRASALQERILRDEERWQDLAGALDAFATEATVKDEKLAALVRLARLHRKKLGNGEKANEAYERVLDLAPGHPEATRSLVDHFTAKEMWDHLLALYEEQLQGGGVRAGQEVGIVFQIAMVNWRMKNRPEGAEPYFERLRKAEPAHPGMLSFFREWCRTKGEQQRLVQILTDAQRALPDGPERAALGAEIAQYAEEGANAQKAVEQWRSVLRSDPTNAAARDALKRLYRQTGAFNHLADLLRSELERTAPDDAPARLPVLREIATIYRENIKSDSALVTVLSQIIALDPNDAGAIRELARVYEALGRWRDLLTTQMRLAELEPDAAIKAELYRSIARRWMDQFSNVQNAVEAYEKLRDVAPTDREAIDKLRDLYTKRRAYRPLYELLEAEAARASGAERRTIWVEMAKIAAERLDRGGDAARLYKRIIEEDPEDAAALDALEKQADRDKDFVTVAEVLEKRVELAHEAGARLALLQKLGSVYSDRLQDHTGALRVWRRVLDLSPGHVKALRILRESFLAIGDFDGLAELYASQDDWEGLVEVLSTTADRTNDTEQKIALSYRCAEIYEQKLAAPERAFRSYERVLSVRPDDKKAAAALVPIYEGEEKWARLPALYEVLLSHADTVEEKRALYKKLSIVTGVRLARQRSATRTRRTRSRPRIRPRCATSSSGRRAPESGPGSRTR
jgi:tetratricopeptide (TPR) repeat protein